MADAAAIGQPVQPTDLNAAARPCLIAQNCGPEFLDDTQLEALKRYRSGGEQTVRVEHVTVNEGARLLSATFRPGGGGVATKPDIDPMNASPRCRATSKRTGQKCRAPAVTGWTVCRFHGAGGGGPKGERNGRYQHGMRTKEAIAERRSLAELRRLVRETLSEPCFR